MNNSCPSVNMFVCLMHGYIFFAVCISLLNKGKCGKTHNRLLEILFPICYSRIWDIRKSWYTCVQINQFVSSLRFSSDFLHKSPTNRNFYSVHMQIRIFLKTIQIAFTMSYNVLQQSVDTYCRLSHWSALHCAVVDWQACGRTWESFDRCLHIYIYFF